MLAALLTLALAADPEAVKAELAKLEGNWQAVAVEEDGRARKIENGTRLAIKDDRFTFTRRNGEKIEGALDLVDAKTMALDLRAADGKLLFRCLYHLEGDALKLAIGDEERPKDFTSTKTVSVATYKRMK